MGERRMLAGTVAVGALLFAASIPAAFAQAGYQQQGSGIGSGPYGAGGAVPGRMGIGTESAGSGTGTEKSLPEGSAYSVGGGARDRAAVPSAGAGGLPGPSQMPTAGSTPGGGSGGLGASGSPEGRRP